LPDDVGFIDADAERCNVLLFFETEAKIIIDCFPGLARRAIHQCNVDGTFGGHVPGRNGVQILHAPRNVVEGQSPGVHLFAKRHDRQNGFLVPAYGRGFPKTSRTIIVGKLDEHDLEDVRSSAARDGPGVGQLQVERPVFELHYVKESGNRGRNQQGY
jgi:hypothetical protein